MSRVLSSLLLVCLTLLTTSTLAHEMSMAELNLREMAKGEFIYHWGAGEKVAPEEVLKPIWPDGCSSEQDHIHCGPQGLNGFLAIEGVGKQFSAVLVKIYWLDGQSRVYSLTAGQTKVHLYGSANDQRDLGEIASAYTVLGFQHILTGPDHLLFVIGLLFLVGFKRQLIWTITAFTVAHSVTLALSALGWLTLHSPPVEATIALSIVLVAGEALHQKQTLSRRFPALLAFLFGLIHGLGFAGALKEIGLPENHLTPALLTFNVGVEIGQLFTVSLAWLLWRLASRWPQAALARPALLYGIGSVAAYWSWLRIAAIFS